MIAGVGAERARAAPALASLRVVPVTVWPLLDQVGDERAAGGAGRACDEDVHGPWTRRRGTL